MVNEEKQEERIENEKTDVVKYMDPTSISLRVFSKNLAKIHGYAVMTGQKNINLEDIIENLKDNNDKEPDIDLKTYQTSTFNFEYIYKFFQTLKKLKYEYVTISVKKEEPMLLQGQSDDDDNILKYYLAPFIEN